MKDLWGGRWDKVKSIMASDLSGDARAFVLSAHLLTFHEMSEAMFACDDSGIMSFADVAQLAGVSRTRAIALVKELEEAGWIRVERRESGRGRKPNCYRVTVPAKWRGALPNHVRPWR